MKESKLIHEAHSLHIPATPLKLLFTLNAFKGKYGIFPLESKIIEKSKIPKASLQRAKKWLSDNGYIKWSKVTRLGKQGKSCRYEISPICYEAPDGWDSSGHFFLKAQESINYSPTQWRFLCLINTVYGWGTDKGSINSLIKLFGMKYKTIKSVWGELLELGVLNDFLDIDSELIFKNKDT